MADYKSSDDMLREFRASTGAGAPLTPPETTTPPAAPKTRPGETDPEAPPALPPQREAGDPFRSASTRPAREPYEPSTAPATGDDRHADWKPRGRSGSPRTPPEHKSWFRRLRPVLVLVAIGAFAFSNLTELFDDSTDVAALTVGDCLNGADGELVESVDVVDCSEAHDFEVYALPNNTASGDYPGADALFSWADQQCWEAFEPYVGVPFEESELFFTNLIPTDESWEQGNRSATCMLHRFDDGFRVVPSIGSARDSGV